MSVTRLLILGAVRIFQPTHGYFVRRELTTWQVSDWAHLNPGSIYNALRALTKEGMLIEEESPDEAATSSRTRVLYRLTMDGESEFQRLVREALWQLHPYEPGWLYAGMSFWPALTRAEVIAALEARQALLQARISGSELAAATMPRSAAGTPDHIIEHFRIIEGQLRAEQQWAAEVVERIKGGAYGFSDDDPKLHRPAQDPRQPPGAGWN